MKTVLLTAVLALVAWNAQAQVTASTDTLALPPTLMPGDSPWLPVVFSNETSEPIDVFGLGANGPFGFAWECSDDPFGVVLAPFGTCTLQVRFEPRDGQPLGLTEGLVGFRLATGTVLVDLIGFSYTNEPLAGVRNLIGSLAPLGFPASSDTRLRRVLASIEQTLIDGRPQNDRRACGRLGRAIRLVEHEAARDRVSEWSAVAMVVQAEAVATSLGCGRKPPA